MYLIFPDLARVHTSEELASLMGLPTGGVVSEKSSLREGSSKPTPNLVFSGFVDPAGGRCGK